MKRLLIGLVAGCMAATMPVAALADSPHFKKGGLPTCTISGTNPSLSVTCTGVLAGLGGDNLEIDVTLSGSAVYQCQNGGGNTAPGQNRVLIGPTTTPNVIPSSAVKNGNLVFTANGTLTAPAMVSGSAAGCPNSNWKGVNPVLTLTSIVLDIYQPPPPPSTNRIFHCTASDPLSGTVALIC